MRTLVRVAQAAVCAIVGMATSAEAGLLVAYDFNSSNIASSLDANVLAGTFNPGVGGGNFSGGAFAFAESTATSEVGAPYATFSLSVATIPGANIAFDRIEFDAAYMGNNGQGTLGLRFVGNGSNVEQAIDGSRFPNFTTYSISLAGISILGDTLKLYVYDDNGGASARIRIDNIRVYGEVTSGSVVVPHVPEPSTLALIGLGAFGFGARELRRRRRNQAAQSAA
jgi:hypothetical protein